MSWAEAFKDVIVGLLVCLVILCFLFSGQVGRLIESWAR